MRLRFSAPWSGWLTAIGAVLVAVALALVAVEAWVGVAVLGAVVALAAGFAVRGYEVGLEAVTVLRPGWSTRLELRGLEAVEADPAAFRLSLRTFGIGGPFAFVGHFRSPAVGAFQAYATAPARSVVLRWPDRTVVVTPDDPEAFVAAVEAAVEEMEGGVA